MRIRVQITDGALGELVEQPCTPGVGARIVFDGIVRPDEDGDPIEGLDYEAYRPMAEHQLEAIGTEIGEKYGLIAMDIEHSVGLVPNFGCSFRLMIESAHRKEGLAAMEEFIDRLKQDVPIWKRAK